MEFVWGEGGHPCLMSRLAFYYLSSLFFSFNTLFAALSYDSGRDLHYIPACQTSTTNIYAMMGKPFHFPGSQFHPVKRVGAERVYQLFAMNLCHLLAGHTARVYMSQFPLWLGMAV